MNITPLFKLIYILLILSTCFFSINPACSQVKNTLDSLTYLIEQSENDSIKFLYTNQIISHLSRTDYSQAHVYVQLAKELSEKLGSKKAEAEALKNFGFYYQFLGQYDSALNYFDSSLSLYQSLNETRLTGNLLIAKGRVYQDKADYINALKMHEESLSYYRKINHNKNIAIAYINLGLAEFGMENYEKATQYYIESLRIIDEYGYNSYKPWAYKGMGMMYLKLGEEEKAMYYFKKMVALFLKDQNNTFLDIAYGYIGKVYLKKEAYDSALFFSHKALEKAQAVGKYKGMAIHQNEIGEIYNESQLYDSARFYFNSSLAIFNRLEIANRIAIVKLNIAKSHVGQGNYSLAIHTLKNAVSNLSISNLEKSYALLSEAYERIDEYKDAYHYRTLQVLSKDSMLSKSEEKLKHKLRTFETEKKDLEINLVKAKLSRSYVFILLLFLIFLTIIGGLFSWKKILEVKQRESELHHEKVEEKNKHQIGQLIKDKEIETVKAGLSGQEKERKRIAKDLHDSIGGTLAAAKVELQKLNLNNSEDLTSISSRIDHACEEIRTISHHLTPPYIKSNSFISLIEEYVKDIQKMHHLDVSLKCYPKQEIDTFSNEFKTEIYRIIQELTINVVKHARAKKLDIQLIKHEKYFNLMIEDDGIGFRHINTVKGIGLKNLSTRLKALKGNFDIDSRLKKGTIVNIDIELERAIQIT